MKNQTQLKVGDKAVINFGNGLTTPVTIIGGLLGSQYKVTGDNIPQWHSQESFEDVDTHPDHVVLNFRGHKILGTITSTKGDEMKFYPHLNDGYIAEYLLSPIDK